MVSELPSLVIAADWSVDPRKRWMARADLTSEDRYLLYPPETAGKPSNLVSRIRQIVSHRRTALIGFDFPIGLPRSYAKAVGIVSWRQALYQFGSSGWENFYNVSNDPSLYNPFFPLPKRTGEKGNYRKQLVEKLGFTKFDQLKRRCDIQAKAESLFYTLGPKQVGRAAINGWREVLGPAMDQIHFWPFDGRLSQLLESTGIVVAEIYPREAYRQLDISVGPGTGRSKRRREDRKAVSLGLLSRIKKNDWISITKAAESCFVWGFNSDDDFDAMISLISMIQILVGIYTCALPENDSKVLSIEGWILGQQP
jgi:hypothetical protein